MFKLATQPWLYPAVCFDCHTGARRSENVRMAVRDVDFDANVATIHEKKKARGTLTTRRVALSPFLREVRKAWLAIHPGGDLQFRPDPHRRGGLDRAAKPAWRRGA